MITLGVISLLEFVGRRAYMLLLLFSVLFLMTCLFTTPNLTVFIILSVVKYSNSIISWHNSLTYSQYSAARCSVSVITFWQIEYNQICFSGLNVMHPLNGSIYLYLVMCCGGSHRCLLCFFYLCNFGGHLRYWI